MDPFKIKVKDEQNFKEVVSLINTFGYGINFSYSNASGEVVKGLFLKSNGLVEWTYRDTYFDLNDSKELTLPQLRDLVVLKRNDINDATHTDGARKAFLDSDGKYHYWCFSKDEWIDSKHIAYLIEYLKPIQTAQAVLNDLNELREEYKDYHKAQTLISGVDVPRLIKEGLQVQLRATNGFKLGEWKDLVLEEFEEELTLGDFINSRFEWRLKPQTIKLELELPMPFEPKCGEVYYYLKPGNAWGFGCGEWGDDSMQNEYIQYGAWPTKEDVLKVVEQLRKIRGTNS